MLRSNIPARLAAATVVALLACPVHAQLASFKNFKHYPTGQWQQELTGFRDGKSMGPPTTSTTCTSPLDQKASPAVMDLAKATGSTCSTKTVTDQERLAEFETVCKVGAGTQTLHVQMRAVDDRTIATETRSTLPGQPETLLKSKVTYLGACPAGAAAAQAKASAADCAEIAKMRKDADAGAADPAQCAQVPAQYRAQCESQMAGSSKAIAALEAQCK